MTLNINGQQVNQIIINKNIFTYDHVWANVPGAAAHNAKLGGRSLGTFNEDYAQSINDGSFSGLWVGDYFTVNGHQYKIAGFNYKANHEENKELGNHLIMLTDVLGTYVMNARGGNAGGFAGSDMFKQEIPVVEKQLATDFGKHLLTFKSYLSTSIDSSGNPNNGQWYELTACLCNSAMWFGFGPRTGQQSSSNYSKYNYGDENTQLPIMRLSPDEKKDGGQIVWLRDVTVGYSGSYTFMAANANGTWDFDQYAGSPNGVRAFFLID